MIHYITTIGVGDAWVGNELRVMKRAGVPIFLHSLRKHSSTYFSSKEISALADRTNTIYPIAPIGFLISTLLAPILFKRNFFNALLNTITGPRENFQLRLKVILHFFVACHLARTITGRKISHIHSQWIHSGGTVAMYTAWLLGVSFSFTGHATDLFRDRTALEDKIKRADFIVCISEFHRKFYLDNGADANKLFITYCGIDTSHFVPKADQSDGKKINIIASGRLVEKKGFEYLIDACKILSDEGFAFDCTIGGSGPLESALKEKIKDNGLDGKVHVTGTAILQEEIPEFMHRGDLYCLPCVWAADNDVDGLPQMLMEAMACGIPVISTKLVGIPDLVNDQKTGLLVDPNNAGQLAEAIKRLSGDKDLRAMLSQNGRKFVKEKFDLNTCLEPLIKEYRKRIPA